MKHAFAVTVDGHRFAWRWEIGDEDAALEALCHSFRFAPAGHPIWLAGLKFAAYLHELKQVNYFEE